MANPTDYHALKLDRDKPRIMLLPPSTLEVVFAGPEFEEFEHLIVGLSRALQDDDPTSAYVLLYQFVDQHPELATEALPVLAFGARKYSARSWAHVPDAIDRYADALARHVAAMLGVLGYEREELDSDSGLPHRAHVACNIVFLFELFAREAARG